MILIYIEKKSGLEMLDLANTVFTPPVKRIFDTQGTLNFQTSIALQRLKFFINKYVNLVQSHPLQLDHVTDSQIVADTIEILKRFESYIDDIPPLKGPRRYGNLACRSWHDKINSVVFDEVNSLLKNNGVDISNEPMVIELTYYIQNCFGSKTRLDFGTGHELSFIAFIAGIDMLDILPDLKPNDLLLLFHHYYDLIKKLILTYTLEPAGSHGVWGLDDHFHFIYILGASQWIGSDESIVKPRDMIDRTIIKQFEASNFYSKAIDFIFTVKSGPFNEHSPILYDISKNVKHWSKVLSGLMKMYNDEVFKKFPVVQHFWFGTGFYPWVDYHSNKILPTYENSTDDETSSKTMDININNDIDTQRVHPSSHHSPHQSLGSGTTASPNVINNTIFKRPINDHRSRITMAPPTARVVNNYLTRNIKTVNSSPSTTIKQEYKAQHNIKR